VGDLKVPLWGRKYVLDPDLEASLVVVQAATSKEKGSSKRRSHSERGVSITSPEPEPTKAGDR
jgi:hypothetical protein